MTRRPSVPDRRDDPATGLPGLCHSIPEPVAVVAIPSGAVLERNAAFRKLFGNPERLSDLGPGVRRPLGERSRLLRRVSFRSRAGSTVEGSARIVPIPGSFPLQAFFHFSPRQRKLPAAEAARLQMLIDDRLEQLKNFERLRSLGEVSAILVHEIRTPLTTIKMAVGTLRNGETDPGRRRSLDNALDQVERVDRLLSGIRDFARPYALDLRPLDAREVVRAALETAAGTLSRPGLVIELEPDSGATTILGDRERLIEAVSNIAVNAAEAMPDGGRITLGVAPARRRRGWTEVRVWDEGPGIPPENLERVFQPFFTTKRTGNGLGLSIVRKIVDLHGGFVTVKSAPGKGTLVMIELPPSKKQ